jgi:hypothetical protein
MENEPSPSIRIPSCDAETSSSTEVSLRVREEVDVGHALELHVAPALRVAVAVAAHRLPLAAVPVAQHRRLLARGLQVVEDAVLDDQVLVGRTPSSS